MVYNIVTNPCVHILLSRDTCVARALTNPCPRAEEGHNWRYYTENKMAGCVHSSMARSKEMSAEEFQRTHFPTCNDLDIWKKSTGETVRHA